MEKKSGKNLENFLSDVESVLDKKEFVIASSVYALAHINDFLLTLSKINLHAEGNPIINNYIYSFGAEHGIFLSKIFIAGAVLFGLSAVESLYLPRKENRIKTKYLLYSGSVLTTLGGLSWMFV